MPQGNMSGGGMGRGMGRGGGGGGRGGGGMGRRGGGMQGGGGMFNTPAMQPPIGPATGQPFPQAPYPASAQPAMTAEQEIAMLENEKQAIEARIQELKQYAGGTPLSAEINPKACTGCGACVQACRFGAITVEKKAYINAQLCQGCGVCVGQCPENAIVLRKRA